MQTADITVRTHIAATMLNGPQTVGSAEDVWVLLSVVQQDDNLAIAEIVNRTLIEDALPDIGGVRILIQIDHIAWTEV